MATCGAGSAVEQVSGSGQCIRPEREGNAGMKEQGACAVVECAQDALGTAILLRRVGTREPENGTTSSKERGKGVVVKLSTVVSMECQNGPAKLRLHERIEGD